MAYASRRWRWSIMLPEICVLRRWRCVHVHSVVLARTTTSSTTKHAHRAYVIYGTGGRALQHDKCSVGRFAPMVTDASSAAGR